MMEIRFTDLGAAFADKYGRASVEEQIRGEINELLSEDLACLTDLVFHVVEMPNDGPSFFVTPKDGGVMADLADYSEEMRRPDDGAPFAGCIIHIPQGASDD